MHQSYQLSEINLVEPTSSDLPRVKEFLRIHFFHKQPMRLLNETPEDDDIKQDLEDASNFYIMALHKTKLVGVLIAGPIENNSKPPEGFNEKWSQILGILQYCEKKADIFRRFNVEKIFFVHVVAVALEHGGQGIGQKLFQKGLELAKDMGYTIVGADCTNYYTSKIAEKLGMECASEVTFDEYHKVLGEEIFEVTAPHTSVKTYVKKV